MKTLFGVLYVALIPFLIWSRWNSEHFVFVTLLFMWTIMGVAYLISVEKRD